MRLCLPLLFPAGQVPYFDNTISTTTGKVLERIRVLGKCVYAVNVSRLKVAEKGLREHALDLGRIEGSRILACSFERVQVGVEIARDLDDIRAWCLY